MIIAYYSLTGNVRRFVNKLSLPSVEITETNPFIELNEPYVLIAPTYDADMTEPIFDFINHNKPELFRGVIGSGQLNFAQLYVFTAKDIARDYKVPLLYDFEYSGMPEDVEAVRKIMEEIQ